MISILVLDHPIVNGYFRYQSSTQILDKILDRVPGS